ncbi:MAG: DEAD/DEAH box helicase family protein [Gemmatimonadaceae bacterium]
MNSEDHPSEVNSVLAAQEVCVAELEHQLAEARARLMDLREQEGASGGVRPATPAPSSSGPLARQSVPEKIALFRSLFRGRDDVYPKFWHNAKRGRSGYSPACANDWVQGVRENFRIKLGDSNREFLPVTDRVIEDHLRGRHIIGVYPLLTDDTCWFLAADFDDEGWQDDVVAFVETSRTFGLAPSVERSRSGGGAHVWFFFSNPVPARTARTVGCFLITETMVRRHQLRLTSYDRLFPNQDTVPTGGFGNLIALPMQRAAAEQGNTLFFNDRWEPHADQWKYLASVRRHTAAALELLAREAKKCGRVLGVRAAHETDAQADDEPWELVPSRVASESRRFADPLPESVGVVIAQRLLVPLVGLPSPLITQIKQLAAFQNPEFYQKQRLRLSTHDTPRIISCAEELPTHLSLPRGCLDDLRALLASTGVALDVEDRRSDGAAADVRFTGTLSAEQTRAVEALARADTGVMVAPPGSGKTVIAIALLARRGRNALVLVHRRPLVDQWVSRISVFTGIPTHDIGQITSGKRRVTGVIDVATVQSLVRKGVVDDLVASYGTVIVDECHHVAAVSIERVLSHVRARYILGLTATPRRRDGLHPIVHMQLGPVRHVIGTGAALRGRVSHRLIVRDTPFAADLTERSIQELYAALGGSDARNDLLFDDILSALEERRSPLVLTERRDHLEYLAGRLRPFTRHLVVMHGGTRTKVRREVVRRLAEIPADEERLVLATGRYVGEGFDDARFDTLFLAMPFAWRGTLVQYAGRLQREYAGKRDVHVYDYVDRAIPVLVRMFEKRLRGYRAMGYQVAP